MSLILRRADTVARYILDCPNTFLPRSFKVSHQQGLANFSGIAHTYCAKGLPRVILSLIPRHTLLALRSLPGPPLPTLRLN